MNTTNPLAVLWGKSDAAGSAHLLLAHLLDAAAVGELMWDRYLARAIQRQLDDCADGRGRDLLALLCGLHDIGKATPAFQMKDHRLGDAVQAAGLTWPGLRVDAARRWHHTQAGAAIAESVLEGAGWPWEEGIDWVWPMIAGHHGCVPAIDEIEIPRQAVVHGTGPWPAAQQALVERVAAELDVALRALAAMRAPSRGLQLALAGLIVMADWIASDDRAFPGVDDLSQVSMSAARERAARAWHRLELRGGWDPTRLRPPGASDLVQRRFGRASRSVQRDAVAVVEQVSLPALVVVEAPTGEGKTEAALAAAEVLAARSGADGVFVGMPTQATCDAMFSRVRRWVAAVDSEVPIALLHGRSRFNREWAGLRNALRFRGVAEDGDQFGVADPYSPGPPREDSCCDRSGLAAAEWFLGRKRGLLAPVAVGTVDQLLYAATRTRHVMLRHAGLAGRVVVLDEVHAYDVYMSQFLGEALRWLADAGVSVVLLSATLPQAMRTELASRYRGRLEARAEPAPEPAAPGGYPQVSAYPAGAADQPAVRLAGEPWLPARRVNVEVLAENVDFDPTSMVAAAVDGVRGGGCALVVCNTVDRAQAAYRGVREFLGADAVLLHARLTAAARAERTERLLAALGTEGPRPDRLVVVATQVAEQSFDVDVDLLVSDLAPIDLLLQRIGRLHRHDRDPAERPAGLLAPRAVVAGVRFSAGCAPSFPAGSRAVYGDYPLLRAAALLAEARGVGWSVPAEVPGLVAAGYDPEVAWPSGWAPAVEAAADGYRAGEGRRRAAARALLLAGDRPDLQPGSLDGLHARRIPETDDDDEVAAAVRDGDPSIEVVLVTTDAAGAYRTLSGRRLGPQGEAVSDPEILEEVIGSTLRLPARREITVAARSELAPLSGWAQDPWLRSARVLQLGPDRSTTLGGHLLQYDDDRGLVVRRER